jgi:2-polyprenyl-6-methoxyphenol hydroxylase-like FAD-dependent oxidoreductase
MGPPQEPDALGYCLSVRREPLDALLLQRAASSRSIADLLWEGERVVGASIVTPDGPRHVHARIVIGADGRHSFVARAVAALAEEAAPASRALYYRYVRSFTGPEGYHRTITLARDLRQLKRNLN